MNGTGQNSEKMRYRVILLLVVASTAFSSAMKELNQLQQFALDASQLMAKLSEKAAPNPVPQIPEIPHVAGKVETCEVKQSRPSVDVPWLERTQKPSAVVPRPSQLIEATKNERPVNRTKATGVQIAKLKKLPQIDVDPVAFEFRFPTELDADAENVITSETLTMLKSKSRRHGIRINPRDREMILKTLNRSINLRIAS